VGSDKTSRFTIGSRYAPCQTQAGHQRTELGDRRVDTLGEFARLESTDSGLGSRCQLRSYHAVRSILLHRPVSLRLPWLAGDRGRCAVSVRDARRGLRRGKSAVAPGLRWGPKPLMRPLAPGGMPEVEVGIVITVLTVEAALQDTCAIFRERAGRGDITPAERDLLIDGAILLAMHVR
jgi:hypothetical protein